MTGKGFQGRLGGKRANPDDLVGVRLRKPLLAPRIRAAEPASLTPPSPNWINCVRSAEASRTVASKPQNTLWRHGRARSRILRYR